MAGTNRFCSFRRHLTAHELTSGPGPAKLQPVSRAGTAKCAPIIERHFICSDSFHFGLSEPYSGWHRLRMLLELEHTRRIRVIFRNQNWRMTKSPWATQSVLRRRFG
jgi:hypothetical protein